MANPWAGEVCISINGESHVMKLTLGALAELEAKLETGSLLALVSRFEDGEFSTLDVLHLIAAGLRGGGWQGDLADLMKADFDGGMMAAIGAAGQALALAFSVSGANEQL